MSVTICRHIEKTSVAVFLISGILWLLTGCLSTDRVRVLDDRVFIPAYADFPQDSTEHTGEKKNRTVARETARRLNPDWSETFPAAMPVILPQTPLSPSGIRADRIQTVPVLVYHRFAAAGNDTYIVNAEQFKAQMRYLKDQQYHVVSLDEFAGFLNGDNPLPEKSVMLTFDDGWASIYAYAYPVMRAFGFPGVLFVYTDFIGGGKAMTWAQIRELSENGFAIACHSKTHRNLTKRQPGESMTDYLSAIAEELNTSRQVIYKKTGVTTQFLAYPYGKTDPVIVSLARRFGFKGGFTVDRGGNPFCQDPFLIRRSMIFGKHDLDDFIDNLVISLSLKAVE
ncbi:MAG: hypothetical protein CSA22_00570 [Deltaproteobacteria bacterium]|nr:MAG: hypothetical protein CSA22_00570 [Deltaproteobacteria bacterium]